MKKEKSLSCSAVAYEIGLSRDTVKEMMERGEFPGAYNAKSSDKAQDQWRVSRLDLERWKKSREGKPPERIQAFREKPEFGGVI